MVSEFSIQPFRSQEEAQAYRQGVGALPAQVAWMAGLMAPSSGISDFLGFYPEMPTEEQMIPTEQMPSFGENIANKQYLDAILQSAGVLGDAAYASIPLTGPYGAIAGTALKGIGAVGKASKGAKVKGIISLDKVYHGSPNPNLTEASIAESKQSENFMPHVSATDNPLLAKSFTRGELGDLPEGQIYESTGNFKIIDYTTDEGKKIWNSLGETDFERATNAKKFGYDGRKINNYEELKINYFYPDIDYKDVKDASEIQFFKNLPLQPSSKGAKVKGLSSLPESEDYITAYHGTAADFDKFDIGKIGTGEGAQAYGHGLYFAEADLVGKEYKEGLGKIVKYAGEPLLKGNKQVGTTGNQDLDDFIMMELGDIDKAIDAAKQPDFDRPDIVDELEYIKKHNLVEVEDTGKLYEVNLKVTPDELLDLDKPLNKQNKAVKKKIDDLFETPISSLNLEESFVKSDFLEGVETIGDYIKELKAIQRSIPNPPPFTGNNLTKELKGLIGAKRTAELLDSVGIKGNKYLDQFSRDAKGGTSNYVIFDDRVIDISKKFGVAIPVAGAMLLVQDQEMAAAQNDSLDL